MSRLHCLKGSQRSFHCFSRSIMAPVVAVVMLCSHTQAYAGITINAIFDSSITSDPNAAAIEGTISQAINVYQTTLTNPITVAINFSEMSGGLGQSSSFFATGPYTTYYNALVATQTSANQL